MSREIKKLQFGEFVLDLEHDVLLIGGDPVPLTPKALVLLKTLVAGRGRIIGKQELMDAVWPDSFVEEGNLPYTANLLRKVLGDSKDEPKFIETVPRRGYRFIAQIEPVIEDSHETAEANAAGGKVPDRSRRSRALTFIAAAAVLAVLASVVWFTVPFRGGSAVPILSRPFSVEQLSTSGSSERAAISPDGRFVLYTDESDGKQSLWLRNLDSADNVQVVPPSPDEYLGLTFSPGGAIYFVRMQNGVHALPSLYRAETLGGVPVKVADNVNRRPTVSPDDKKVAFSRCTYQKAEFCSVIVADAGGGNERKLMSTESGVHIWDLRFAPDGRSVAVAKGRFWDDKNDSSIVEVDAETGEQREVFGERFAQIGSVEWMPDRGGLLFSASDFREGPSDAYSVALSGGKPTLLTRDAASYQTLGLDHAGGKMIAVQNVPDYRLNLLRGGSRTVLGAAKHVAASSGGRVVYSTFSGDVWSISPDGTEQRQLTNSHAAEGWVRVSPDRSTIYFSTDEGGNRQVWRMNGDGTDRRQITHAVGGYPLAAGADGRFVFYESTLDSRLYKVAADGGGEESLVLDQRLLGTAVSPDGARVAYSLVDATVRKVAVLDLATKQNVKVIEPPAGAPFARPMAWSADGEVLYYAIVRDGKNQLWQQPMDDSPPQKIGDLGEGELFSLAPLGGGDFAYVIGRWRYDVMLLRGLG